MTALKLTQIGNSVGLILPKESRVLRERANWLRERMRHWHP